MLGQIINGEIRCGACAAFGQNVGLDRFCGQMTMYGACGGKIAGAEPGSQETAPGCTQDVPNSKP